MGRILIVFNIFQLVSSKLKFKMHKLQLLQQLQLLHSLHHLLQQHLMINNKPNT
jgi:hypothetical protein